MDYTQSTEWEMILKELDALGDLGDEDLEFIPELVAIGESTEY